MASAASATFRLTQPSQSHSLKSKPRFTFPFKPLLTFSPLHKHQKLQIAAKSTDVSKEDIQPASEPVAETDDFDKRRLEEKFAVLNTGIYECRSCGYLYNEAAGDPSYPIAPGLPFDRVPDDWRCPTCGAAKSFFASKSVEIAGFAQNQQFGLGGNTLTSGQKAILIYGSLLFFFVLFLSGYFLQ
ncbi:putative rubredoxin, iron-binding protein [Helianthus annuus]|uniref:Putative rubredoxin-like superfamily protein n=1 Tax=Helianthus annuus TaxID=4232 RepID=A0A251UV37_HELAN|nr:rubredoxin [Helianthus annuus]KAF5807837.1 putative rubredoxin, iron-binding protein [Helianthus annuus]KAJ0586275.1 putative rubredoxin, iron-binding protein [Helianthus annuus]KAJ0794416.1 putative rubredoxin, iron-binding protein [Helianthus annuus]KAJ0924572.1 putative rubredoxin, iron-binding protein [Helianthus annuus]KAJ0929211.1 putative rubredoxin, iron-binding protein [Helianthus annuus]